MKPKDFFDFAKTHKCEMIDLKFVDMLGTWQTGAAYQMYHALAIVATGLILARLGGWWFAASAAPSPRERTVPYPNPLIAQFMLHSIRS
jgi:hypothetical protein